MNVFKKLMQKVGDKVSEVKQVNEMQNTMYKFKRRFEDAKAVYEGNLKLMNERELIYLGTREVDGNANDSILPPEGRKKSNNVRNIAYEFIESQVDNAIPQPIVKAKKKDSEWKAQMIEDSCKNDIQELNLERMNDLQERVTPIHGMSFIEVMWNNDKKKHSWIGEVELINRHPKQFIPQPGIWNINEMDYFFILSSVSSQYILKRYGVNVDDESEEYPDVNTIDNSLSNSTSESTMVTEMVAWYKDEDGDICRFVWVNNKPLEDLPKIFYRRDDKGSILEFETLQEDIQLKNGTVIPAGTQLPFYAPKKYPIVMRENVPVMFAFGGQSDIDVIRDQQDAIKKVTTKLQEKILKGGSIVILPESLKSQKLNDQELKIMYLKNPTDINSIRVETMQPDISKDLTFLQQQYKAAQSTLGINDSFQGKEDSTATSGIAKQIQVAQASGRIKSKQANKYQAYKEVYELIFQFKLAFFDEPRPYLVQGRNGQTEYAEFYRYEFLTQDETGEWYYDDEFMFSVDAVGGLPNDKMFLLNQTKELYKDGAFGQPGSPESLTRLWQVLEHLHYPQAGDMKMQMEQQIQIQQQMAQMQQTIQQLQAKLQGQQQNINPQDLIAGLTPEEQQHLDQNPQILESFLKNQGGVQ